MEKQRATTSRKIAVEPSHLKPGVPTAEAAFYKPILKAIHSLGGAAAIADVARHVEQQMLKLFTQGDYRPSNESGTRVRWQETLSYAHHRLIKKGWLEKSESKGFWKMTPEGVAALKAMQ